MTAIKKNQIITNEALQAPLELGANFNKLNTDAKELIKTLENLVDVGKKTDANLDLAKSTSEVAKETKNLVTAEQELQKIEKQIQTATARQNSEYVERQAKLKEIRAEQKKLVDSQLKLVGTEEKLIARNKELKEERKKLNLETAEGTVRLQEINDELDDNTAKMKGNVSEQEKLRFQVGDYRNQLEGLTVQLFEASQQEGGIVKLFQSTTQGLASATKAGLRFIATPIGAILAAIVLGIAALTTAMSSNQDTADKFNRIWEGVSNVLDEVFGRVGRLANALVKFVSGDFSGAAEEASKAFTNFAESMRKAYEEGTRLFDLMVELEKAQIAATTETARLEGQISRLNITADNATKSFKEREAAAIAARAVEQQLAEINIDLARRELELINIRVSAAERRGNINRELQKEQAEALAEFIRAENELVNLELENDKIRSELKQDRLEKDLDILIDGFDNVKTINERIIADDQRTLDARREVFEQTAKLGEDSFNKQIETIRKFTKIRFDENELLAEQDAVALNERIRGLGLSEIIEGRLLEVIRERRIVLQDLSETEKDLQAAEVDRLTALAENERLSINMRIAAYMELGETRLSIQDSLLSKGIINEEEYAKRVAKINEELSQKIADLAIERAEAQFDDSQLDASTEELEQLLALNQAYQNDEISSLSEFEEQKKAIQEQAHKDRLSETLSFLEAQKDLLINAGIDTSGIDNEIAATRLALAEENTENIIEQEKKLRSALNELGQESLNSALSVIENLNEAEDTKREEDLEKLTAQYEAESEAAEGNEERQKALKEKFAAEKAKIDEEQKKADRKRAIFERALAIVNIGINTGVAIVKAVAATPLTGGLPFSAIAAAIGAVQLAAVLSKPIPAFAKGVRGFGGGTALVNEEGFELIEESGKLRVANDGKAGLTTLKAGSNVYTHKESMSKIMEYERHGIESGYNEGDSFSDMNILGALDKGFGRVVKAVKQSRPVNNIIQNNEKFEHYKNAKYN